MVGSLHTKKKTKERKSMPGLEMNTSNDKPSRKRDKERPELSGGDDSSGEAAEGSHSTSEGHVTGTSPRKADATTPRLRTKLGVARSIRSARDFITQSTNTSHSPSAPSVELPKPIQPPPEALLSPRDSLQSPRQKISAKILHSFTQPLVGEERARAVPPADHSQGHTGGI